jgi:hypothetical protein
MTEECGRARHALDRRIHRGRPRVSDSLSAADECVGVGSEPLRSLSGGRPGQSEEHAAWRTNQRDSHAGHDVVRLRHRLGASS